MSKSSQDFLELGHQLAQKGTHQEARAAFLEAWRLNPQVDPLLILARYERSWGDLDAAHVSLSKALEADSENPEVQLELGYLFHQSGQMLYALKYFQAALKQKPMAEAWHQLGRILQQLGRQKQAEEAYTEALSLEPNNSRNNNSLGLLYYFSGNYPEAIRRLQKAVDINPDRGIYHLNLGMALLQDTGREVALTELRRAIGMEPGLAGEVLNIGEHFFLNHQYALAMPFYEIALGGQQDAYAIHVKLAQCAERECEMQMALDHCQAALRLNPERWLLKIYAGLLLPLIYQSNEEIILWRERFQNNLKYMLHELSLEKYPQALQSVSIYSPAFQLAYQGFDNRLLLEQMSLLWQNLVKLPATPRKTIRGQKKRIGFLSCFFFRHSVTGVYLGLMRELARSEAFELFAFSVGDRQKDDVTEEIQTLCTWETLDPGLALARLSRQVIESDLDILIYPELGLEPVTYLLAQTRLAPIQALMFGHPCTSGIRSIDFFLSPDCVEPPGAEEHYTETLVRLPGCPFLYQRPARPQQRFDRSSLGLKATDKIYLITGTLFKLHPDHDVLFQDILQKDSHAQIVLIQAQSTRWHQKLQERFVRNLGALAQRIHFVPWLEKQAFFALMLDADVVMDTLHFGSGNVAYQALGLGVPVLTFPGSLMRSNTTAGMYQLLGINGLTAHSSDAFVKLCLDLAHNKGLRREKHQEILKKSERIFDNPQDYQDLIKIIDRLRPAL